MFESKILGKNGKGRSWRKLTDDVIRDNKLSKLSKSEAERRENGSSNKAPPLIDDVTLFATFLRLDVWLEIMMISDKIGKVQNNACLK